MQQPKRFYGKGLPDVNLESLNGQLIVVEGADGSGRSTQINLLRNWLERLGFPTVNVGLKRSMLVSRLETVEAEAVGYTAPHPRLRVPMNIVAFGMIAAFAIHRLASDRLRRGPAWGCGFPDAGIATQYSADSFAQPIRRVFGTVVFQAREIGEMPPPGSMAPARLTVVVRDLIWDFGYAPIAAGVNLAADRLNYLQFLTIRSYLSLVFTALVLLLLALAIWP